MLQCDLFKLRRFFARCSKKSDKNGIKRRLHIYKRIRIERLIQLIDDRRRPYTTTGRAYTTGRKDVRNGDI